MIVCMDIDDTSPSVLALPDGQRISIEVVHPDGYVAATASDESKQLDLS